MRSVNHRRQRIILATLAAFGLASCGGTIEDPFVPKFETERLRIGTSFDDGLCAGHSMMWESHIDIIEQTFGVSRDFAWLFLYLDNELEQIARDCGDREPGAVRTGCWRDSLARSTLAIAPHELVHAWMATIQPRYLPALGEGLAVRMTGHVLRRSNQEFTVDDLVQFDATSWDYEKAGHFVAWLLETYGSETFMELYGRTSRGMTQSQISAVFVDILGKTPEAVLQAYASSAKEYYPGMGGTACGQGPVVPWQDDAATWPAEGSCLGGPFFGFESSSWWQRVTIEVPTPGTYLLDTAGRLASMTRCLTVAADESELPEPQSMVPGDWKRDEPMEILATYDDWEDYPLELEAGRYDVIVERRSYELASRGAGMSLLKL